VTVRVVLFVDAENTVEVDSGLPKVEVEVTVVADTEVKVAVDGILK
jgi:hypothetical protein